MLILISDRVDFSLIPDENTPTSDLGKFVKKKTGVNVGQMATSLVLAIITMVGQIVINTTIDHAKPAGAPHQGKHYNAKRGTK